MFRVIYSQCTVPAKEINVTANLKAVCTERISN